MRRHNVSVTIGIPTYNEEGNIGNLLSALLSQEEIFFTIEKIIIVSDASDKTNTIVRSFNDKRIQLIENTKRSGQVQAQNLIFQKAESDFLLLLEADTLPQNNLYIAHLLEPMLIQQSLGMVQGNWVPLPAQNLIEKILSTQFSVYHQLSLKKPQVLALLCSGRGGRAFRKNIYKRLQWPAAVPEDVYTYLWCMQQGIQTKFVPRAVTFYRCAQSVKDYYRERQKIASAHESLKKYFPEDLLSRMYYRSLLMKIDIVILLFIRNPFLACSYFVLKGYIALFIGKKQFTDAWPSTSTTKLLQNVQFQNV